MPVACVEKRAQEKRAQPSSPRRVKRLLTKLCTPRGEGRKNVKPKKNAQEEEAQRSPTKKLRNTSRPRPESRVSAKKREDLL
jgi:hypothetical protein